MEKKIRIGVVGLGFGQHHVRTLANMDEARLVAVADRHPDVPGGLDGYARQYGAKAYQDGIEMIERESLDAVSLCTSPRGRAALIEAAAGKGLPMFVEKPWATDLPHARQLAELCQQYKAKVMVAFSFRFHPAIVRLRELIDGDLGPAWMLNGEYVFNWVPPAEAWLWDPANGNGFFNENSCHLFDAVCYLLGDPVSVMAEAINPMGAPSENAAALALRFAGGAIASLTVGGIAAGAFRDFPRIDVIAVNGQAKLSGREHIWDRLQWATRDGDAVYDIVRPPEALGNTRYTHAFRHFFECVRSGEVPSVGIKEGLQTVALAMAVYESAQTGQKVEITV
ncbi:MAG: Gfo/Idh/MocA family oxidoreductase [Anaerolineae bacterium]|nr:Gfo/Idh/MocA family oxidoreductase [Anaerolineae bacterium]